jgi:hypothetical protein
MLVYNPPTSLFYPFAMIDTYFNSSSTTMISTGERCYVYAKVVGNEPPSGDTVGGMQLSIPLDEAQKARLKIRLVWKKWGALLGFRKHCFALVELAKAVKEQVGKEREETDQTCMLAKAVCRWKKRAGFFFNT